MAKVARPVKANPAPAPPRARRRTAPRWRRTFQTAARTRPFRAWFAPSRPDASDQRRSLPGAPAKPSPLASLRACADCRPFCNKSRVGTDLLRKQLASPHPRLTLLAPMEPSARAPGPTGPVTLSVEQIQALCAQLSNLRHELNNDLSKIVGTAELIKLELQKLAAAEPGKPPLRALERLPMLVEQPRKIAAMVEAFTREMEKALGVSRP